MYIPKPLLFILVIFFIIGALFYISNGSKQTTTEDGTALINIGDDNIVEIKKQYGISEEDVIRYKADLKITDNALNAFILKAHEKNVPIEHIDSTLRNMGKQFNALLANLERMEVNDAELKKMKDEITVLLKRADFEKAEELLNKASDLSLQRGKDYEDMSQKRKQDVQELEKEIHTIKRKK